MPRASEETTVLSIRAELAARAMQGILANEKGSMTSESTRSFHPEDIAKYAVKCADELIKKLNKDEKIL